MTTSTASVQIHASHLEPVETNPISSSKPLDMESQGSTNMQRTYSNPLPETLDQPSSASISSPGGDRIRPLHFYSAPPDGQKPFFKVTEANGVGFKNYACSSHPVLIRDVREHPTQRPFRLSVESFKLLRGLPAPPDIDISDDDQVKVAYSEIAKQLVRAHVPGVQDVVVFDQTVRRASADAKLNRPVKKVHVDQSFNAGFLRAQEHLPKEQADAVLEGKLRLRIINVWRPLHGPISDHPLCLAESASVPDSDLVEIDHIYHSRKGETYHCRYRGVTDHRFWYLSSMETSDGWMIQCFDSQLDPQGRRRRCVHASFEMIESNHDSCEVNGFSEEGKSREYRSSMFGVGRGISWSTT